VREQRKREHEREPTSIQRAIELLVGGFVGHGERVYAESVRNPKPLPANNTPEQRNRPLRALCRAAPLPPVWHNVGHPWEA
jgi:hypothetical protein